jgi:multisubunit Na+/H+ antiporter MnhG subunit
MKQDPEIEKIITAETVIETIIGAIVIIAAIVAVFALIWAQWYVMRVALSIVFVAVIATIAAYYITDKLAKK